MIRADLGEFCLERGLPCDGIRRNGSDFLSPRSMNARLSRRPMRCQARKQGKQG